MKKKKVIWVLVILCLITPVTLIYLTFSNSTGCSQFVIDTYEIHSGITIPDVDFVNCYYDELSNTRISIYSLKSGIDLSYFEPLELSTNSNVLNGLELLEESERPNTEQLYKATGEKWGTKWTYVLDQEAQKLWAELTY